MSLNFASLYRSVLKQIHTAARVRPHHLQDIRFILSYPPAAAATSAPDMARLCSGDLRRAVLSHSSAASVAERFVQLRALSWLRGRLAAVLSPATDAVLREARGVAAGLSGGGGGFLADFLTDAEIAGGVVREAPPGERGEGVASAGELVPQREMFILRHVAPMSLPVAYLSAFGADEGAVAKATGSSRQLIEYVKHHVARSVTCSNDDMELTVTVRPFDPLVAKGRPVEGDPFALVNRYFMVRFEIKAHDPFSQVNVVNSYFLRLDAGSSELLEDVGYIHPSHVWKLAQTELEHGEASGEEQPSASSAFELMFVNLNDTPMVMKGQLYYVISRKDGDKMTQMPVQVIAFGQLLFFNEV